MKHIFHILSIFLLFTSHAIAASDAEVKDVTEAISLKNYVAVDARIEGSPDEAKLALGEKLYQQMLKEYFTDEELDQLLSANKTFPILETLQKQAPIFEAYFKLLDNFPLKPVKVDIPQSFQTAIAESDNTKMMTAMFMNHLQSQNIKTLLGNSQEVNQFFDEQSKLFLEHYKIIMSENYTEDEYNKVLEYIDLPAFNKLVNALFAASLRAGLRGDLNSDESTKLSYIYELFVAVDQEKLFKIGEKTFNLTSDAKTEIKPVSIQELMLVVLLKNYSVDDLQKLLALNKKAPIVDLFQQMYDISVAVKNSDESPGLRQRFNAEVTNEVDRDVFMEFWSDYMDNFSMSY